MLKQLSLGFLGLSIVSSGFSVSLSQGFLVLGFLTYLPNLKFRGNIFLVPILFLIFAETISSFWNVFHSASISKSFSTMLKGEWKDLFLIAGFFLISSREKKEIPFIKRAFFVLGILLFVTSLISLFSPYRLSSFLNQILFSKNTVWPYATKYGELKGVSIFIPNAMFGSHLTLGGIFLLLGFFLFGNLYENFLKLQFTKKRILLFSLVFAVAVVLLLFNNSRSAILGIFCASILGIFLCRKLFLKHWNVRILKTLGISVLILIPILVYSFQNSYVFNKAIQPFLGSEKHTDGGRYFIWNGSMELFQKNPIFGIGSGNFNSKIEETRTDLEIQSPEIYYFYEIAQKGHSHNDLLHMLVCFGILGGLAYLFLFYAILKALFQLQEKSIPFLGLAGFLFAGLLQCYFQDDEVVILFWYLLGFFQITLAESNAKSV